MSFIKSLVNDIPNVKMGFDWKSSGNEYEEDKRKWQIISSLLKDFFKKNGEVDEEVYKEVEAQVLRTVSFLFNHSILIHLSLYLFFNVNKNIYHYL